MDFHYVIYVRKWAKFNSTLRLAESWKCENKMSVESDHKMHIFIIKSII